MHIQTGGKDAKKMGEALVCVVQSVDKKQWTPAETCSI